MTASYPFHHPNSVHIRHPRLLLTPNKRAFAVREKPSLRPFEKGSNSARALFILQLPKILPSKDREQIRAVLRRFLIDEIGV
jgi:hypothetical protein